MLGGENTGRRWQLMNERVVEDNGCKLHPDCFSCPYDDCEIDSLRPKHKSDYYQRHKEAMKKAHQKYYEKNKDRINAERRKKNGTKSNHSM